MGNDTSRQGGGNGQQQQPPSPSQTPADWQQCIRERYPALLRRAHFLPPLLMHRTRPEPRSLSLGLTVSVLEPPVSTQAGGGSALQCSDVRDDRAQQIVLNCLRQLAEGHVPGLGPQVMFVLSQLQFGDYLCERSYKAAASRLPRPKDLTNQKLDQGDFDVLIIHRQYGILAGEIKSVGSNRQDFGVQGEVPDDNVLTTLKKTLSITKKGGQVGQLRKAREVLSHIMHDFPSRPRTRCTLILPYIAKTQLERVLNNNPAIRQALCEELDLPDQTADPADVIVCSDHVNNSQALSQMWRSHVTQLRPDPAMNESLYTDIVSRFAGPATVVRIFWPGKKSAQATKLRTEGEFVGAVGSRFGTHLVEQEDGLSEISLYPEQVDIINNAQNQDLAYLAGPPGTGKTLMLVLAALGWLREGLHVIILITLHNNMAVCHFVMEQLQETARRLLGEEAANRIHIREMYLYAEKLEDLPTCAEEEARNLVAEARRNNGQLCIIADESSSNHPGIDELYTALKNRQEITRIRLWAANYEPTHRPYNIPEVNTHVLKVPLRCPPSVTQEVRLTNYIQRERDIPDYREPTSPLPAEGPPIRRLEHWPRPIGRDAVQPRGPIHPAWLPSDCEECGIAIAHILNEFGVGQGASPALQYRDVLLLTYADLHHDSGVAVGLRRSGFPVCVVRRENVQGIVEMGRRNRPDEVTVAFCESARGLERKIVVYLDMRHGTSAGRLSAASRCTSQLIWVKLMPEEPD